MPSTLFRVCDLPSGREACNASCLGHPRVHVHYWQTLRGNEWLKRCRQTASCEVFLCLLQVSVLRIFHQLLANAPFMKQPGSSEMLRFAVKIVRHAFERLVPAIAAETAGKLELGTYADDP